MADEQLRVSGLLAAQRHSERWRVWELLRCCMACRTALGCIVHDSCGAWLAGLHVYVSWACRTACFVWLAGLHVCVAWACKTACSMWFAGLRMCVAWACRRLCWHSQHGYAAACLSDSSCTFHAATPATTLHTRLGFAETSQRPELLTFAACWHIGRNTHTYINTRAHTLMRGERERSVCVTHGPSHRPWPRVMPTAGLFGSQGCMRCACAALTSRHAPAALLQDHTGSRVSHSCRPWGHVQEAGRRRTHSGGSAAAASTWRRHHADKQDGTDTAGCCCVCKQQCCCWGDPQGPAGV